MSTAAATRPLDALKQWIGRVLPATREERAAALWSFAYKMYWYGHHLDPKAAVRIDPFTPPLFGYKKLANFEVYSYPGVGSYALGAVGFCLLLAFFLAWREARRPVA
jgi:hypothetical protein